MKFNNSVVKLNISDIKKKFKVWDGMKLEIFIDSDVKIEYADQKTQETQGSNSAGGELGTDDNNSSLLELNQNVNQKDAEVKDELE